MMILFFLDTPAVRAFAQVETTLARDLQGRTEILDEFDRFLRNIPTPPHRNPEIRVLLEECLVNAKQESGICRKRLRMEL